MGVYKFSVEGLCGCCWSGFGYHQHLYICAHVVVDTQEGNEQWGMGNKGGTSPRSWYTTPPSRVAPCRVAPNVPENFGDPPVCRECIMVAPGVCFDFRFCSLCLAPLGDAGVILHPPSFVDLCVRRRKTKPLLLSGMCVYCELCELQLCMRRSQSYGVFDETGLHLWTYKILLVSPPQKSRSISHTERLRTEDA